MIYTKAAKVISAIAFVVGAISVVSGFLVVFGVAETETARFLGSSGKAIDRGFYCIFAAVLLGVISEISCSIKNNSKGQEES